MEEKKEQLKEKTKEPKKAKEKEIIPHALHQEIGNLLILKQKVNATVWQRKHEDKFKELIKEAEKYTGHKARKTQTISISGHKFILTAECANSQESYDAVNSVKGVTIKEYFIK